MAKSFEELKRLMKRAKEEGIDMSELGRRGGNKAARMKKKEKEKDTKGVQLELPLKVEKSFKNFFTKPLNESVKNNPYNSLCPICKEPVIGRCRCPGPHSLNDLQAGHGLHCKNGHHWSGDLVYNPKTNK